MTGTSLVGGLLIAAGCLDALIGFLVVLPRVPESTRGVLRAAFVGGALVLILVGAAFLAGVGVED